MMDNLTAMMNRPFIRFALSGGFAAAVNILSRLALSQVTTYSVAIVIAYLLGMTTAYVLMKLFVFEKSGRSVQNEYIRFGLVNLVALVQVWAVSMALARFIFPWIGFDFHAETVAHIIGVLSPIATSYFMHKYFTFAGAR
ncbi:GtrA family protein [Rhizobium sp. RU36D]|uniref:GtrA family protein n=1 Tax=Rhizobium sp. RU36D TaxID=1907415 RepID=UPI0009D88F49|nr:GtrA family protein [Rhizobium sp. RU36D]SMC86370.1 Putative flippase GtrA (transmembrane translocase of bactoprenol-linked glucose) [Rhizobium sp. RU36D]